MNWPVLTPKWVIPCICSYMLRVVKFLFSSCLLKHWENDKRAWEKFEFRDTHMEGITQSLKTYIWMRCFKMSKEGHKISCASSVMVTANSWCLSCFHLSQCFGGSWVTNPSCGWRSVCVEEHLLLDHSELKVQSSERTVLREMRLGPGLTWS